LIQGCSSVPVRARAPAYPPTTFRGIPSGPRLCAFWSRGAFEQTVHGPASPRAVSGPRRTLKGVPVGLLVGPRRTPGHAQDRRLGSSKDRLWTPRGPLWRIYETILGPSPGPQKGRIGPSLDRPGPLNHQRAPPPSRRCVSRLAGSRHGIGTRGSLTDPGALDGRSPFCIFGRGFHLGAPMRGWCSSRSRGGSRT